MDLFREWHGHPAHEVCSDARPEKPLNLFLTNGFAGRESERGVPPVGIVEELESRLGKPVVTSNQAMFWHALRLAGYTRHLDGFGRLLRT